MRSLIIIPARGGSKGIPRKNIKLLNGKPLIEYTIEAARKVTCDENIFISTDDVDIKNVVENTGLSVPFLRPNDLATDESTTQEVLLHVLEYFEGKGIFFDVIILLQATSPFRTGIQVKEAMDLYSKELDMIASVKETKANPYYLLYEESEDGYLTKSKKGTFTRRQDCPKVYEFNGAIYVINTKSLKSKDITNFKKVKKYVMDNKSSVDIDDNIDWQLAEILIKNNGSI